jgi:nucleoside-diphosphate-sugar epimerase
MPKRSGKTVAVTGASGYIAGRLIQQLLADERTERVLGFDVREPRVSDPRFVFDILDVRNAALESRLSGVDVVVHLAFIMDPIHDEKMMRDVNVGGSQNVFRSAARAGVKKIVYASSATVYGAHPDNPVPLTEDAPLRANLDFSYPAHKLEVEYVLREFREEYPDVDVVIFRPSIVFGPKVDNAWSHFLEYPMIFGVKGFSPVWQFVHEEDVVRALAFGIDNKLDGPYNLSPKDWIATHEVVRILDRKRVELSEPRAFAVAERLWRLGVAEAPAGMLHYVMHPWVVSPAKLEQAGFSCERSTAQTFAEVAENAKGYLRLGRKRMQRADVTRGAAAGIGIVGAAVALRRARRRAG